MDMPRVARFGLRRVTLLAVIAEHRLVAPLSTSRLMTLLRPRERRVAMYIVAEPADRKKMDLPSELRMAAEALIAWSDSNNRTRTTSPS